jgi:uncharacterized repeat protein (TIGR01451 family)
MVHSTKLFVSALFLAFAVWVFQFGVSALSSGQVSFTLTSGDSSGLSQDLMVDSNNCPTDGPSAMYITGNVTNASGGDLVDFSAQMTNFSAGFSLAGGQADTISLGTLAAGASKLVGWLVQYSCTDGATGTVDVIMSDDNAGTVTSTLNLTVRSAISANAGGEVTTSLLGPGAIVGQIIEMDVTYEFGGASIGNEYFLQPTGTSAFNAGCFSLVGSEILSSNVTAVPVGVLDDVHFVATSKQTGNGHDLTARYFFQYLCAGTSTTARPFAAQTSGASNLKYTGNFDGSGSISISYPGATNPFIITKTASQDYFFNATGGTTTYTVAIENPSAYDSFIDEVVDILPAGVIFTGVTAASDIIAANSNSMPTTGATGTLTFSGSAGTSYAIAGGSTLNLVYTATIPDIVGDHTNTAEGAIGLASTGTISETVTVSAGSALTATKTVSNYDPLLEGIYSIPSEEVVYNISGENISPAIIDDGTIIIVDGLPAEVEFYNGDFDENAGNGITPVEFTDNGSGLTCCAVAHLDYSSTISGTPVWGYVPSAGFDSAVRYIKISPEGEMSGNGAGTSAFSFEFRARIK